MTSAGGGGDLQTGPATLDLLHCELLNMKR